MDYIKKEFKAGDILSALDLNNMGDGIEEAISLAQEGAAGAANMEKGAGNIATNQSPRSDKVTQAEGETAPHFNFTGHPDAGMAGRVQYGAVGDYSASLNGRSAALKKHSTSIGNSTVAKGEESFAQGYESIAEGGSSFAGGSQTWAEGEAATSLGMKTKATGKASTAFGAETWAKMDCSLAGGKQSVAEGYASTALGLNVVATNSNQTVVGQYNDTSDKQYGFKSLFQVGCGDENNLMNGLDVGQGGSIMFRWDGEYYLLQSVLSLMNNYINLMAGTEEINYFEDAKASLTED
jgi:hypothetical protein